jgi:hypothetical protein
MTLLWIFAALGWLLAFAAYMTARSAARRLKQLTEMYWELKYDHGELKAQVRSLTGQEPRSERAAPGQAFVPLGDLRKK